MKKYLSISLLISFLLSSENIIDGYAYDATGEGILDVEIYIKESSTGSVTDASGYFKISLPISERIILSVSHVGYVSKEINVNSLDSNTIIIYLDKKIMDMQQIVVTALGYESYIKDTPIITHVITSDEIQSSPYNLIEDIMEFAIPNVQKTYDSHGDKITIQGLDNKSIVFMVDGNKIAGEFAGNIDFSMIDVSDIERIEIIRSGMSTLYGSDSIGGIINIITKKNKKKFSMQASYSYDFPIVKTYSFNVGAKLYNFNYKLHLDCNESPGYDLTDFSKEILTLNENMYYKIKNSLFYSKNKFNINYTNKYYIKNINKIKHHRVYQDENGVLLEDDYYMLDLSTENPVYQDLMHALIMRYQFNNLSSLEIKSSKEVYQKSFYYPYYNNPYPYAQNSDGKTIFSALATRYDFSVLSNIAINNYFFHIGFEYVREIYQSSDIIGPDGDEVLEQSTLLDGNKRLTDEYSIFFTNKFQISENELVAGIRLMRNDLYPIRIIPSVSLRRQLGNYNLRLNYSQGYRIPSLKEMYYKKTDHIFPIYGNSKLSPSLSNYYAISFESRELANSYIEIYINNIADMIYTRYDADLEDSTKTALYYDNSNLVNLYGCNITMQEDFNKLGIDFIYSYTDGKADKKEFIEGISHHTFNIRMQYDIFSNTSVMLSAKYNSSKDVYTYDQSLERIVKIHLQSYYITDMLIAYKKSRFFIKLGLKNIFNYLDANRTNTDILTTTDPGRRIYFNLGVSI